MPKFLIAVICALLPAANCGCQTPALLGAESVAGHSEMDRVENQSRKLPENGAWVSYHVTYDDTFERTAKKIKLTVAGETVETQKTVRSSRDVTLSFVGNVVENRKPCRWMEITIVVPEANDQPSRTFTYKVLVTEKGLWESKEALDSKNIVRIWQRQPDGTVTNCAKAPDISHLFLWTPGAMRQMASTDEAIDIEYPPGHFESAQAWNGTEHGNQWRLLGLVRNKRHANFTVWSHPQLPIGFARMRWQGESSLSLFTVPVKLSKVIEFTLQDSGTNAHSKLPEYN